jgi:uncharacterized membrane protein YgcG
VWCTQPGAIHHLCNTKLQKIPATTFLTKVRDLDVLSVTTEFVPPKPHPTMQTRLTVTREPSGEPMMGLAVPTRRVAAAGERGTRGGCAEADCDLPAGSSQDPRVRVDHVPGLTGAQLLGLGLVKHRAHLGWNGEPADGWASALQKAVRQGDGASAAHAAIALFLPACASLGDKHSTAGAKARKTNLLGRLSVIAVEDVKVGVAPCVAAEVDRRVNALFGDGVVAAQAAKRDHLDPGAALEALSWLCAAAEWMAHAAHLRLLSDLKSACHLPPLYTRDPSACPHYLASMNVIRASVGLPHTGATGGIGDDHGGDAQGGGGSGDGSGGSGGSGGGSGGSGGSGGNGGGQKGLLALFNHALDAVVSLPVVPGPPSHMFADRRVAEGLVAAFDTIGVVIRSHRVPWDGRDQRRELFAAVRARCEGRQQLAALADLEWLAEVRTHKERPLYLYEAILNLVVGGGGVGAVEHCGHSVGSCPLHHFPALLCAAVTAWLPPASRGLHPNSCPNVGTLSGTMESSSFGWPHSRRPEHLSPGGPQALRHPHVHWAGRRLHPRGLWVQGGPGRA